MAEDCKHCDGTGWIYIECETPWCSEREYHDTLIPCAHCNPNGDED